MPKSKTLWNLCFTHKSGLSVKETNPMRNDYSLYIFIGKKEKPLQYKQQGFQDYWSLIYLIAPVNLPYFPWNEIMISS